MPGNGVVGGGYQPETQSPSARRADFDLLRRVRALEDGGGGGGGGGVVSASVPETQTSIGSMTGGATWPTDGRGLYLLANALYDPTTGCKVAGVFGVTFMFLATVTNGEHIGVVLWKNNETKKVNTSQFVFGTVSHFAEFQCVIGDKLRWQVYVPTTTLASCFVIFGLTYRSF
jgi:hypothetical protein